MDASTSAHVPSTAWLAHAQVEVRRWRRRHARRRVALIAAALAGASAALLAADLAFAALLARPDRAMTMEAEVTLACVAQAPVCRWPGFATGEELTALCPTSPCFADGMRRYAYGRVDGAVVARAHTVYEDMAGDVWAVRPGERPVHCRDGVPRRSVLWGERLAPVASSDPRCGVVEQATR